MEFLVSQVKELGENPSRGCTERGELFREMLEQRIGGERLSLWFGPAGKWEFDHNGLSITLENAFLVDCVRNFCWDELKAVVAEMGNESTPIRLKHDASVRSRPARNQPEARPAPVQTTPVKLVPTATTPQRERSSPHGLVPTHSPTNIDVAKVHRSTKSKDTEWWASYVRGTSSRLATTAIEMMLERPGTISPLLMHGPSGSGKSHLAKASAQELRRQCGLRRTVYMTAEQFTIDYTESARGAGFASFRKKYRDVDAFILDDLQFCLGKSATLAELRNTLDNLIRDRKQIVLVSDRSLTELSGLGNDLVARVAGGMSCSVDPLDVETRRQLLTRLLEHHEVTLSDSTINALVESAGGDGRALYGIVFRLLAEQRRVNRSLQHDEALTASLDLIRASQPVIRLADIERVVCENFRLEPKSLQTKGKTKFVSGPRMLAMFLARKHTRAAYSEIGEFFGKRQHSTVISAQKKVNQWLECNEAVQHGANSVAIREVLRRLEASLQVG